MVINDSALIKGSPRVLCVCVHRACVYLVGARVRVCASVCVCASASVCVCVMTQASSVSLRKGSIITFLHEPVLLAVLAAAKDSI